jgi:hypothetical protein
MTEELLPCPFCGSTPDFPDGQGTFNKAASRHAALALSNIIAIEPASHVGSQLKYKEISICLHAAGDKALEAVVKATLGELKL